jgi:hypothetical protein
MGRVPGRRAPVLLAALAGAVLSGACTPDGPAAGGGEAVPSGPSFEHDLPAGAPTPWAHESFDADADKFTFAIFTDLTGGERDGIFSVAVEQLNLLRPEFIISVGDLIEGGTEDRAQLATEWDGFDERADRTRAPVFYVGGNHDLTNLVQRDVWEQRYGRRYYHFAYRDVLFIVLDTEDNPPDRMREIYEARDAYIRAADAGDPAAPEMEYMRMPERRFGQVGAEQAEYVLEALARYPDVRWTFLFMHKPIWMYDPEDPEFASIEAALSNRPYTLFNGHFHTYSRTERHGRDYIMLGTTGGSQNPRSDMGFDQLTLVTVDGEAGDREPTIATLRMDGILDAGAAIPLGGDTLCFQASACGG